MTGEMEAQAQTDTALISPRDSSRLKTVGFDGIVTGWDVERVWDGGFGALYEQACYFMFLEFLITLKLAPSPSRFGCDYCLSRTTWPSGGIKYTQ